MMLSNALISLRRYNEDFPADPTVELQAIGAVLTAPKHSDAAAFLKRAQPGVFFCRDHAWLWGKMIDGIVKGMCNFHSEREFGWWLSRYRIIPSFKSTFGYSVASVIVPAFSAGLWWHGNYYLDCVIEIAKRRNRIVKAAAELSEALGCGQ